jgi:hypothetical protein
MKKLVTTLGLVVLLAAPSAALAHHIATGATKRAVVLAVWHHYTTGDKPLPTGHDCYTQASLPCARVVVSANSWANETVPKIGDGGSVLHLVHGHWRWVAFYGGGIGLRCQRIRIPKAVVRDLHIPCRGPS